MLIDLLSDDQRGTWYLRLDLSSPFLQIVLDIASRYVVNQRTAFWQKLRGHVQRLGMISLTILIALRLLEI